jgi:hypothetical protein
MSERAQQWLLWTLAVALVVGTAVALRFARGYQAVAGLAPVTPNLPPSVLLRLDGIRAEGRRDNRRAWTLHADRVDTTRNHDRIDFAGNVGADLLLPDGKPRATITAPSASYTDFSKSLSASGKIVVLVHSVAPSVKDDLRIETEKVNWNVGGRQVVCPGVVSASLGGSRVVGSQLSVDMKTRELSLHRFEATFSLDSAPTAVRSLGELAP